MSHANGRDQMTAMLLEAQVFTPMKQILELNTLQYQAGVTIFSPSLQRSVEIDPVELRKTATKYKITDGLTPTEKAISGDEFAAAIQMMATSPQLGAAYNLAPAFSYLMKTRNVDFTPFEKSPAQVAFEQAMSAWQQVVVEIAKANGQPPPQPKPADYGYTPGPTGQTGASTGPGINVQAVNSPSVSTGVQ